MNELISMQIDVNLPPGQGHDWSTSGVRRSKVKVIGGRSYLWKSGEDILNLLSCVGRGIQGRTENIAFEKGGERGVAHIVNCTPCVCRISVLLTHLFYSVQVVNVFVMQWDV